MALFIQMPFRYKIQNKVLFIPAHQRYLPMVDPSQKASMKILHLTGYNKSVVLEIYGIVLPRKGNLATM